MDGVCAEYVCDHGLPEGHDSSYLSRGPIDSVCAEYVCDHGLPKGHDSSYLSRGQIETRRAYERNRAHHVRASFFPSVRSTNLRTLRCVCSNADRSTRRRDRATIIGMALVVRSRHDATRASSECVTTRGTEPIERSVCVPSARARETWRRDARDDAREGGAGLERKDLRGATTSSAPRRENGGGETTGRRERV